MVPLKINFMFFCINYFLATPLKHISEQKIRNKKQIITNQTDGKRHDRNNRHQDYNKIYELNFEYCNVYRENKEKVHNQNQII